MDHSFREALWNQFGAGIDMLAHVISNCPDDYFSAGTRFYYLAFHSTLFLDYYLTFPPADFVPMLAFTQKDQDDRPAESVGDFVPDQIYPKAALLDYLAQSRLKCAQIIAGLRDDPRDGRFVEGDAPDDMNYSRVEILLYNLRHTQHHTGQLYLLVRQDFDRHMEWSFRVGDMAQ
ncbi:DinB family protein [Flavobacterium sp.]|uniref:DinB family protein n=1 Tax=Flavobacterium sp. TaxID=239 RepID=UPI0026212E64|nr:DinB family protein [Flavobacterium sp.]